MRRHVPALLLAALAAGCGGDDTAGTLPSPLASTTTAPAPATPTPTRSASPEAQIEQAARAYYAALADAGQTGDVRVLERLLAKSCACRKQVDHIRSEARAGRTTTTTYQVESVEPHDVTATGGAAVVTFSSPESVVVDRSGRKVKTLPALKHVGVDLFFRRVGSTWVIERVVRLGA